MRNNIPMPTDFSENAWNAMVYAIAFGAKITIMILWAVGLATIWKPYLQM